MPEWSFRFLADLVLATHFVFVLFVLAGALLVLRWKSPVWLHVPALVWAILLKTRDLTCPLTPLEKWLRERAGDAVYSTGFIDHYLLPLVRPASLAQEQQMALDTIVISANVLIYTWILWRWHGASARRRRLRPPRTGENEREGP